MTGNEQGCLVNFGLVAQREHASTMTTLSEYLDFAIDAAWQAGRLTLAHYQTGVAIERKPDRSVVTVADRAAEQLIRRLITARFPDHAIVGEEFGGDTRRRHHAGSSIPSTARAHSCAAYRSSAF